MINFDILDKEKNVAMLSFSTMQMPTFKDNKSKGFVEFGKNNDFPNQLLRLYEEHSEHAAIVGSKSNYLFGEGFKAKDELQQPFLEQFLAKANRYEDWYDLNNRIKVDLELFNACYFQVITDLAGKPKEFYHLSYASCRVSKDKNTLFYKDNWLDNKEEFSTYKEYNPTLNKVGVFFIRFEYYKPTANTLESVYPLPQYIGCIKDISTDIDISTFNNNYVANGFSAGTLITFFNGEPTPDQKREIKRSLLNTHSSPDKAGSIVINYANKDGQAAQITALNVDDLDKKFEFTSKRALEKILRGHNVTNPELFGVKTEGQLGTRVSLKESYELMINTYTKPRQGIWIKFYEDLITLVTGIKIPLEIKQLELIGYDKLSAEAIAVQTPEEVRALLGLEPLVAAEVSQAKATNDALNALSPLVATKVLDAMTSDEIRALASLPPENPPVLDENGQPIQAELGEANEHIKTMTRKQTNNMHGITNDYRKGKATLDQALLQLKGYGLSEDAAYKWLGLQPQVKMSKVDSTDFILAQFASIENTTKDLKLELISEDDVHFHTDKDAVKFELAMEVKFADVKKTSWLDRLISGLTGTVTPTPTEIKDIAKEENPKVKKTQILTKYYYEVKPDAPALKTSSRKFCKEMMALSKDKDGFTYEQIDSVKLAGLSNGFDEVSNIWDYRGGFYTNPNTGETDPFCRHYWKAKTYRIITE